MIAHLFALLVLSEAQGGRVEGAVQDPTARVAELAPELKAKEVARVYRAVERLAELGAPAASLLEARAKEAPEHARPYLLLAADEARRAAELPGGGRARRFTITYAPQDLGALLADFRRRTGARFSTESLVAEELPDVGVELKESTFAEALQAIARAAKMSLRRDADELYLEPSPAEPPTFTYAGYFLCLRGFNQRKIVDFRRPARSRVTLGLEVFWDPALRVVAWGPAEVTRCADDQGRRIVPAVKEPGKPDDEPLPDDGDFVGDTVTPIELEAPSGGVARIAILRGLLAVKIERASEVLTIEKPAEGATAKKGGFELRLKKTVADEGRLELELASPGRKPEELRKMPVQVTAYDKAGERVASYLDVDRSSDALKLSVLCDPSQRVRAPLIRRPELQLSRLEVSIAVDCLERRVPFEFRDLKIR